MGTKQHQMRRSANEKLDGAPFLSPREALALLKTPEAPVAPVEIMIEESVSGRWEIPEART
jgi:hypothetical protein